MAATDVAAAFDDTVVRLRDADQRDAERETLLSLWAANGKPPSAKELDAAVADRDAADDNLLYARAVRKLQAAAEHEQRQADAAEEAAVRVATRKLDKARERLADAEAAVAEAQAAAEAARARADEARAVGDAAQAEAESRTTDQLPAAPAGRDVNATPQTAG